MERNLIIFAAGMPIVNAYDTHILIIVSPVHFTIPGLLSQVRIVRSHLQNNKTHLLNLHPCIHNHMLPTIVQF